MRKTYISIYNTVIHHVSVSSIVRAIRKQSNTNKPLVVFPVNIHILVELSHNPQFLIKHNEADMVFADGAPLTWLSRFTGQPNLQRVSGTELAEQILKKVNNIFLIAPTPEILQKVISKYNARTRRVVGGYCPPNNPAWGDDVHRKIVRRINTSGARVVLVGVGPLKQERWILDHAHKTHARAFVAVGSAFDILSGSIPRAPTWMQNAGLEWTWRVMMEPKRLGFRYGKDVAGFLFLVAQSVAQKLGHQK